ncbi:other/BUB protein kinase [Ephemerocybe angulata]|uniref:Other/BUB protein kinase n=1 Tax=Ephemerocybe angulata TaxID=980116 RepID=A0A8H6HY52_9AGAR|nr:other/BUB protein kinase [Tulosesus angulatus]
MSLRSGDPSSSNNSMADKEKLRQRYRAKVAKALDEDDDPLAAYHQFIQWTIKTYGEKDPKSGLKELLKEATSQFKEDPMYKTDLRYLKMWALHARQLDKAGAIAVFADLLENGIGTSYAALYEDYANLLEHSGKYSEAEKLYLKGIERGVRPLERLKTRYKDFQSRSRQKASIASSSGGAGPSTTKSLASQGRTTSSSSVASTSAQSTTSANIVSFNSTAASRYALMLAPPPPGKRPEKLRFNMGLLFTDDGVEYSIQEARARSMGLLGKKWGPPPTSELPASLSTSPSSSLSSAPVDFNDDGQKSTRMMNLRRRSAYGGGAEPTVTINTKEALADVFGMYNSPERTSKLALPGSKHAPLKKVEPVTPMVPLRPAFSKENENSVIGKTPGSAFRPFSDENASQNRMTPGAKFSVFVEEQNKTPFVTSRTVFGAKDAPTPAFAFRSTVAEATGENQPQPPIFSKVFNPPQTDSIPLAPLRDVFTDDHGKPTPKARPIPTHERAKSHHDIPNTSAGLGPVFTPFKDENAKTPFKVFSRPPSQNENPFRNAFTPKTPTPSVFTPFSDAQQQPAFTPFGSKAMQQRAFTPFAEKPVTPAPPPDDEPTEILDQEEEEYEEEEDQEQIREDADGDDGYQEEIHEEQEEDEYYDDPEHLDHYQTPLAPEHNPEEYADGGSYQRDIPLGGRFGAFNVMTPITERTFELTSTGGWTPSQRYGVPLEGEGSPKAKGFLPFLRDEIVAAADAERLAAELREGRSEVYEEGDEEDVGDAEVEEAIDQMSSPRSERKGGLSLVDTLTLTSKFRPANPCNPFDPPVLSTLLSRIPTDPHFYDLHDQDSQSLPQLQKFFKKTARKGSSAAVGDIYPLALNGNRFQLSEKLGEGGFGCVFKARDLGVKLSGEDSDSDSDLDDFDDEDEENSSVVALKVVKPRNLWEYHVLRRLHSALTPTLRRSVVLPHALYAFNDESFLVLDYCPQGMLLDIVNNAASSGVSQAGACLDELLVMFFSIELLRLLEGMHSIGFVHGDLKIDNCLIRLEDVPGGASAWSPQYQPSGEGGWSFKGLKVIDFGRTIDTRLFPAGQEFIAEWDVDERDCFEIQEGRPWTYQTDYYGLAGIVYCMLFGKYMSISAIVEASAAATSGGRPRYKIGTPFKRYWQADIWNKLFDILLNPRMVRPDGQLPLCEELGAVRKEMEVWLQANCNRTSNTLKGLLKKVEMSCYV